MESLLGGWNFTKKFYHSVNCVHEKILIKRGLSVKKYWKTLILVKIKTHKKLKQKI